MLSFKSSSQREYYSKDQGELPGFLGGLFACLPEEILQPRSPEEAVQAVREARRARVPVVPRGAGSTAFGQAVPVRGGRVLDLCFMKAIVGLNPAELLVTVEAGVRWSDLSVYLEEKGLALGSYPSSWYTTVGGWIATGGLGLNSLMFGPLKNQVAALRVCRPDGEEALLHPGDALFDAFFETEGQMGLILEATLKVRPRPEGSFPCLVAATYLSQLWSLVGEAAMSGFELSHASVYNAERMRHFNHTLAEKMRRKGSEAAPGLFEERPCAFFHLESAAESRRFHAWLRERGFEPEAAHRAAYVWMERFYPLKGKRADRMFLGSEAVVGHTRATAYCEELERLAKARCAALAIESNAAGPDESVVIASFSAPYGDAKAYLPLLGLVFQLDAAGREGGARLYHVGIYNTPHISHRFDAARLASLRALKSELDPGRLFNPGKFFGLSSAKLGWLPDGLHLLGARLLTALLGSGPGLLGAQALAPLLGGREKPELLRDKVFAAARECVSCGFCLPVCPAYLATRDERTTARGKLFLASKWLTGGDLNSEDVELLHSCMHCAGCTRVCQSAIDLVPVWYELEGRVAARKGKPTEAVEAFVRKTEASADYKRLLRRGFISEPAPPGGPRPPSSRPSMPAEAA